MLFNRKQFDANDPLLVEGPAKAAHNGEYPERSAFPARLTQLDVTIDSGPVIIDRYLSDEEKHRFLKPGYRFRIVK